jgi:hypothetical protein
LKNLGVHFNKAKSLGAENNHQHLSRVFLNASYSTYDWEMLVKGGKGRHSLHKKRSSPYAREEVLCEKLGLEKLQNQAIGLSCKSRMQRK